MRGIQNSHEFLAGDGFLFIEEVGQLIQLFAVVGQDLDGFLVLGLDEGDDLLVDLALGLGRAGKGGIPPPRYWLFTVSKATMSKSSLMP